LNETFFGNAFNKEEQSKILSVTVKADTINADTIREFVRLNDTTDKVFLLNLEEAHAYFNSNDSRKCAPTDYAISKGVETGTVKKQGKATCDWWLRSVSSDLHYHGFYMKFMTVRGTGTINTKGVHTNTSNIGVRPAIWVKLDESV
jgi:hypothetical protein